MINTVSLTEPADDLHALFLGYFSWASTLAKSEYAIEFDPTVAATESMANLAQFFPPHGRMIIARTDSTTAGVGCLKTIGPGIGEIKRMYVRPEFRRRGIARALITELVESARSMHLNELRLDSARFMTGAHALYRGVGFQEIEPYEESEIPPQFQKHWLFMSFDLSAR